MYKAAAWLKGAILLPQAAVFYEFFKNVHFLHNEKDYQQSEKEYQHNEKDYRRGNVDSPSLRMFAQAGIL